MLLQILNVVTNHKSFFKSRFQTRYSGPDISDRILWAGFLDQIFGPGFGPDFGTDIEMDFRTDIGTDFRRDFRTDFQMDFQTDFRTDFWMDCQTDFRTDLLQDFRMDHPVIIQLFGTMRFRF